MYSPKRSASALLLAVFVLAASAHNAIAQSNPSSAVPRLVNYSGKILDKLGKPASGVAGAWFAIYRDEQGGAPLWTETQNVTADKTGYYTAQLGASKPAGLPLELFSSGEARWLGVTVNGGEEQARVLLLSVPYALKAADAETLGGKPASAFLQAPLPGSKASQPAAEQANEIVCTSATGCKSGTVPLYFSNGGSAKVGNSLMTQSAGTVTTHGSSSVTGNQSVSGNIATSGAVTAGAVAATNGSGAAIVGTSHGTSGGSDGVDGVTTSATASGVAGINQAPGGIGVYGAGDISFYSNSNVQQVRNAGGWVKAMAVVNGMNPPYSIERCFNSTLSGAAATTTPCGFNLAEIYFGAFNLDFGFEVDDRFYSTALINADSLSTIIFATPTSGTVLSLLATDGSNGVGAEYSIQVY